MRHFDVGDPRKVDDFYLMGALGEKGHFVMVRFDPLREKDNYTVVIDDLRIADTDNPHSLLVNYWDEHYGNAEREYHRRQNEQVS